MDVHNGHHALIKSLDHDLDIKVDYGSDYNDQDKNYQAISVVYCTKLNKDKHLIYCICQIMIY